MDSNRRLRLRIGLGLCAMTLVVYGQVWGHEFTEFDDQIYVVHCPLVQGGLSDRGVREAFTTFRASNWHPLTWLSLMADRQFFGNNPGAFHLTNLGLHLACVLLLFLALGRLTGAPWRSGLVAALFAIHPLHVESVAWISERKDVLSTFFWMLVLWGYSHYVRKRSLMWYLFVCGALSLGLLAKPMLVTLPCVLLLLDYWPLDRVRPVSNDAASGTGKGGRKKPKRPSPEPQEAAKTTVAFPAVTWQKACLEKLPLFVLALAASSVTLLAQRTAMSTTAQTPFAYRLSNAVTAYVTYLIQTIWPVRLACFYPWRNIEWSSPWPIAATLFLIGVTLAVVRAKRLPWLLVGWLWYLGTLVPVIGLVQVGTQSMADRYTYIPLIGIFIMAAWSLPAEALTKRRGLTTAAAAVALGVLMFLSWRQVGFWRDTQTLFAHALDVTEKNWMAHINLGTAAEKQGKIAEAQRHYEQAWRIFPQSVQANTLLADLAMRRGDRDEARKRALAAIRISPETAEAQGILGLSYAAAGEFEPAITHFQAAVRLVPDNPGYRYNLGLALADSERLAQAADEFRAMIRLKPDAAPAYHQLGIVLTRMGLREQARESFRKAVQLDPRLEEAQRELQAAP
jgi:Flp pilus assembly protein TadD